MDTSLVFSFKIIVIILFCYSRLMYRVLIFLPFLLFACKRDKACTRLGLKGVCIHVINNSGQSIEKIVLATRPCQLRNINQIIENNDETHIAYKTGGESSYWLFVILKNGDTLKSQEHYAEGGYKFTETIEKQHIITTMNSSY